MFPGWTSSRPRNGRLPRKGKLDNEFERVYTLFPAPQGTFQASDRHASAANNRCSDRFGR